MNTTAKLSAVAAAAGALLGAVSGIVPASAQGYGQYNNNQANLARQQRQDYLAKRADIANEWQSVRAKQHIETEMFHAEDAQIHAQELAYRAAHNGQLSPQAAARFNQERLADKERELTAQHRATYKAQFNVLRADRRYAAQKERLMQR